MLETLSLRHCAIAVLAIAVTAILGAWIFEYFGFAPCELCLKQRFANRFLCLWRHQCNHIAAASAAGEFRAECACMKRNFYKRVEFCARDAHLA